MLSQKNLKLLRSLKQKKFRQKYGLFTVEGVNDIKELLKQEKIKLHSLFLTDQFASKNEIKQYEPISIEDLKKTATLSTNEHGIAICQIPKVPFLTSDINGKSVLVLDKIRDPGNLGTLIRSAIWFGISTVICSNDSVDSYNMKTITSSKGGIFNINIVYEDLNNLLHNVNSNSNHVIFGADLDNNTIKLESSEKSKPFMLVLGNEALGISNELKPYIHHVINITQIGSMESLNVAIAGSILLYELTGKNNNLR